MWFALPLSLAFILFVISAFAETNRLPFDMPEAESELVTGYHTEYSAMKFSAFMISEFGHMVTASALMATLFLGGWDIPFFTWDDAFWYEGAAHPGLRGRRERDRGHAQPLWKTLATFGMFALKTGFFLVLYIWIRWTLPRFRYDQVMALGLEGHAPDRARVRHAHRPGRSSSLDELGMTWGFGPTGSPSLP